jgi:hypothetical protein
MTMETRKRTKHTLVASNSSPDNEPITVFDLVRRDSTETRRSSREDWREQSSDRKVIATITRSELVTLIADGADQLAYLGDAG